MVSDGNMLGSGCETNRISSSQDFGCPIVLKDSAHGGNVISIGNVELATDLRKQRLKMQEAAHASTESNVLKFLTRECK